MSTVRNLDAAFASFTEHWQPRTIAVLNDYDVRVVKVLGEFTWHAHPDTDELFLVLDGEVTIEMDAADGGPVSLRTGDVYVVPRGRRHRPVAAAEARLLLVEPSDTSNTGDAPSHRTAERRVLEG